MSEIDFYPELCVKLEKYLLSYLPKRTTIKYAYNNNLSNLIRDIEIDFNIKSSISNSYLPNLKLDILIGINLSGDDDIIYLLFEVKHLKQLSLADYSQLTGYLQVAKQIKFGFLLIVLKEDSSSQLSNVFSDIINMKSLPMDWEIIFAQSGTQYSFNTGICYYVPNNGIDWIDAKEVNGISSFERLSTLILSE